VVSFINQILPTNEQEVNNWTFYCILLYILAAYLFSAIRKRNLTASNGFIVSKVYGGANLGVSSLLAPSLISPQMVTLMGDHPLHLTIAGMAGLAVAVTQFNSD
jgi:hypothetical protein